MRLSILDMTCAFGDAVGLDAFARRIYAGQGLVRHGSPRGVDTPSPEAEVSLVDLVANWRALHELGGLPGDVKVSDERGGHGGDTGPNSGNTGPNSGDTGGHGGDTGPNRWGIIICGGPEVLTSQLAGALGARGDTVMTARVDAAALVEALDLAAAWLADDLAAWVVVGQQGPGYAAAVLITAVGGDGVSGRAEIMAWSSGDMEGGRIGVATGAATVGLLETVNWPPDAGVVAALRGQDDALTCAVGGLPELGGPAPVLSLIKAALCIERRMWVPTPEAAADVEAVWRETPLFPVAEARPWFVPDGEMRMADLVLCAPGGEAAHVWVAEVPGRSSHLRPRGDPWRAGPRDPVLRPVLREDGAMPRPHLIPVVGSSADELLAGLSRVRALIVGGYDILSVAAEQCCGAADVPGSDARAGFTVAIVGRDRAELLQELGRAIGGGDAAGQTNGGNGKRGGVVRALETGRVWQTPRGSVFSPAPVGADGVTFVYPGVFNSYVGLGRDLFQHFPWLHNRLGAITEDLGSMLVERALYPRRRTQPTAAESDRLMREATARLQATPTAMIQSGATMAIAHTMVMRDLFGVRAHAALGYSMGEVSMLWATGVWQDADPGSRALHASSLFRETIAGPMTSVRTAWGLASGESVEWTTLLLKAPVDHVRAAVAAEPRAYVTFVNLKDEVVIAGEEGACKRVVAGLDCHALPVPASVAIHNPAILAAHEEFVKLYTHPVAARPRMVFYSAAADGPLQLESAALSDAMATMCCQPVDFPALIQRAYRDGARLFLELGPLATCTRRIQRILKGRPHAAVAVNPSPGQDFDGIVRALAVLVAEGVPVNLSVLYPELAPVSEGVEAAAVLADSGPRTSRLPEWEAPAVARDGVGTAPGDQDTRQAGVLSEMINRLLPHRANVAQLQRAFLRDRAAAQFRARDVMSLQMEVAQRVLDAGAGGWTGNTQDEHRLSVEPRSSSTPRFREPEPALFDAAALRAFARGDVTECFGDDYAVYGGRRLPRIPNGDLLLMSRVLDIQGDREVVHNPVPGSDRPPAHLTSAFDVPVDAWFYEGSVYPGLPPYVALMEMALQPCGFLSAYLRSSLLAPDQDLYFRNLDGRGRVVADVDLRGRTVVDRVRLLSSTRGQGVIIQTYDFSLSCEGITFYEGWASFGYFPLTALRRQVGLDSTSFGSEVGVWLRWNQARPIPLDRGVTGGQLTSASDCRVWSGGRGDKLPVLLLRGVVNPHDWYFKNHFYQDPVMPGSLGVEAAMQALSAYGRWRYPALTQATVRHMYNHETEWKYRGQITPEDSEWREAVFLDHVERDATGATLIGDMTLWKGELAVYRVTAVGIRLKLEDRW